MGLIALTRRRVLQAGAAAGSALGFLGGRALARAPEPSGTSLNFLAVGDWGRDGLFHQKDVADRMGELGAAMGARFVVSVGDNFYEDGVASVDDPKWRTSFEDVYTAPSLQVPWHVALGNHDYHGSPDAQIAYSQKSQRWRMPARYFTRTETGPDGTTLQLFFTDTSPQVGRYYEGGEEKVKVAGQDVAAQRRWLEAELARSTADWKIVIGHHPIFTGGEHGDTAELVAHTQPLLERYGVQLYLNGHDHDLQHIRHGAVTYVCTGAGSKTRPTSAIPGTVYCSDRSGFSAWRLTREQLALSFHDYTGAVLHEAAIARVAAAA